MLSALSVPQLNNASPLEAENAGTRVEAGSNTSTVTLRVVGGDEKGSLESETVKYGHDRPVLSSERAPHMNKPANV
jgi:hypothetical protein